MRDGSKNTPIRHNQPAAAERPGATPPARPRARNAGEAALFEQEEASDSTGQRAVIWRWQLRRRRR